MTTSSPEESEKFIKKEPILIERKIKRINDETSISYNTSPIDKLTDNEEEKSNLLKLTKNILLSCNFSYLFYATSKLFNYLKTLLFYNFFYFIAVSYLIKFVMKENEKKNKISLWKKLLLFNLPELLIIFFYRRKQFSKINKSINSLFVYLSERILYVFNIDKNNNYIGKLDTKKYNILLFKKNEEQNKDSGHLYTNNIELLSKDTFFNSVIAYPNANFGDFDFNNLEENEDKMFQEIFKLINEIQKKIISDHSFLKKISSFAGNLSYTNSTKFNILYALGLKLAGFLIEEFYLNKYAYLNQRKKLIEEKTKEFNQKNMEQGYFLALDNNVILLFKIKDNFKSFDESYSILYSDCQNLLNNYFN